MIFAVSGDFIFFIFKVEIMISRILQFMLLGEPVKANKALARSKEEQRRQFNQKIKKRKTQIIKDINKTVLAGYEFTTCKCYDDEKELLVAYLLSKGYTIIDDQRDYLTIRW